jgi:D-alanyl-lipoteichoic acid acyltransferase DltB (MBOAT superfamily)
MSLTGWLTEYIFMPINVALREWGLLGMTIAIMANLFLVGVWHGANWTFAVFGLYHGLLFIPLILSGEFQKKQKIKFKGYIPNRGFLLKMIGTYLLVSIGLVIFKAPDLGGVWNYFSHIFIVKSLFSAPPINLVIPVPFAVIVILLEWRAFIKGKMEYAVQTKSFGWRTVLIDLAMIISIFWYADNSSVQFIYFQF